MKYLYEHTDDLNSPIEAFDIDTSVHVFPVMSHWHYFIEIIYIIEGSAWITLNEKVHVLETGEMIFIQPQVMHSIHAASQRHLRYSVIKFDVNSLSLSRGYFPRLSALFRKAAQEDNYPVTFTNKDFETISLQAFFASCVKEMKDKNYGYDISLQCAIGSMLIEILRIWRKLGFVPEGAYAMENTYSIHDILEYIEEHSTENLKVETLANMCHMSYSYFAKTFHTLYGKSCKQYIEFIRLCKVENLLLFTDYDLNYISNETGFSDCSHLIRIFKRKYNMTPKQYRLTYQKK